MSLIRRTTSRVAVLVSSMAVATALTAVLVLYAPLETGGIVFEANGVQARALDARGSVMQADLAVANVPGGSTLESHPESGGSLEGELKVSSANANVPVRAPRAQRQRERAGQLGFTERGTSRIAQNSQSSRSASGSRWIYVPQF